MENLKGDNFENLPNWKQLKFMDVCMLGQLQLIGWCCGLQAQIRFLKKFDFKSPKWKKHKPVNQLNFQVPIRPKAAVKNQIEMRGMRDQHGEKLPTNAENFQNE